MSDLDDTLRSILTRYRIDSKYEQFVDTTEQAVKQTKAAFAEAGYVKQPTLSGGNVDATGYMINGVYMTSGQEWYERFKAELFTNTPMLESSALTAEFVSKQDVLLAARLAANITEDTK